jgi:SAM-dependent methyltransferase
MEHEQIDWSDAPKFGRSKPLKYTLELLHFRRDRFDSAPLIVETGTTRGDLGGGLEGDGWATLVFSWYCKKYGGTVITIDIEEEAIENCKIITHEYKDNIIYHVGDSVSFLEGMKDKEINLLYLDSADDPTLIKNELLAASDNISPTSIILIDDTHDNLTKGKGTEAGPFLLEQGWSKVVENSGVVLFLRQEFDAIQPIAITNDIYLNNQEVVEDTVKLEIGDYDDKAALWHNIFFNELPPKHRLPIDKKGKCSVLDLGCNTGYNTKMLADIYGYADGVDINSKLIFASKVNHDNCKIMDVSDLKYDAETFSLVVGKDVLEHSDNPTKAIEEVHRVLVHRGRFLFLIPLDGQPSGVDDVAIHPIFNYGNLSHVWKATLFGALARIYEAGFTNVGYKIVDHEGTFGQKRELGNDFLIVWGEKRRNVIKLPIQWLTRESHWGAFVTLRCSANCSYCLQKFSPEEFYKCLKAREEIDWKHWATFYTMAQKKEVQQLSVVGGEPTLYPNLANLVNALEGYYVTVTSNLHSALFNDIEEFASSIQNKSMFRLNTSYHPDVMSVEKFAERVHRIRASGIHIDQVAMVDHPGSQYRKYYLEFINHGLQLTPQTFLGKIGDNLFPNQYTEGITNNPLEHQITNYDLFEEGFSYREKKPVQCSVQKFLVAPNGDAHRCHYHLYSGNDVIFNITKPDVPPTTDYTFCDDFGFCNPCDYPRAQFKSCNVDIGGVIGLLTNNKQIVSTSAQYVATVVQQSEEFKEFINVIIHKLYSSLDPRWTLYNDKELHVAINKFVGQGEFIDNAHARIVAEFEKSLFRVCNVNVYRILDEIPLFKYLEASCDALLSVIRAVFPELTNTENCFSKAFATCSSLSLFRNVTLFDPEGTVYISGEE